MRFLIPLLFLVGFAYGQPSCFPDFDSNYDFINHFEFNSLLNINSGEDGDYTIYSIDDFTTSVTIGETYSMQVASEDAVFFNNRFTAWIDYNNDGFFSSDEVVLDSGGNSDYKHERVDIPMDSSYIGVRTLRVMMAGSTTTLDPCGQYDSGESEDYLITITGTYEEPCYCTPFSENGSGARIEDFYIGDILNCNSSSDGFSSYSFYPDSIFTTELEIGKTYRLLVSKGTNAGVSTGFRVSIDFNDNYIFETNESILVSPASGPGIVDKYITIPNNTSILGQHRMRARISYHNTPSSGCFWARGETEDYIINIVPQDTSQVIIPDWQKVINLPADQRVYDIIETYDNGYAVSLAEYSGLSKPRLMKFSIDGDILWSKYPPSSGESRFPLKMHESHDGGFIICGLSFSADSSGEPYVTKLDACGDQQWHQTYGNTDNYDYASHIIQASDSNYVVLAKYLNDTSRIALIKLDTIGNVIWQNDYTHHSNSEPRDLIETSDKGFLITGRTYTPNPGTSTPFWLRSMIIKIDSSGNEEWEKVLGITDTTLSSAFSSVELETGGFLVSASTVDYQTNDRKMGVYRVDEMGDLLFYKPVSGMSGSFGQFIRKMEGNKYCLVSSIYSDCFNYTSKLGLYMIDSDVNILDSSFVEDYHLDIQGAVVTENNKLVVSGSKQFPDHDDIFMFKFNESLEFDTLHNMTLDYDWLCEITVSQPELAKEDIDIDLYPNPTCEGINIQINESGKLDYIIDIISLNGSLLKRESIHSNQLRYFSLEDLNPGMYIITISHNNYILSTRKIIKSK